MNPLDLHVFKNIVETSLETVIIIDIKGDIIYWNSSAEKLFGYSEEEVIGKYVHEFLPAPHLREKAHESFLKYQTNKTGPLVGGLVQVQAQNKSGDIIDVQFGLNAVNINNQLFTYAFLRDVSDSVEYQKKLTLLSETDELTGLLNRRAFNKAFKIYFSDARKNEADLCLLALDIDKFKKVNDTYGHDIGDLALKMFSEKIQGLIRKDDYFGRLGGEEFFVFIPGQPLEIAKKMAERMRQSISEMVISIADGYSFRITVSIGVTKFIDTDSSTKQIYKRADKALYKAKNSGRNRVKIE